LPAFVPCGAVVGRPLVSDSASGASKLCQFLLYFLEGPDTSINGILDTLNLILHLIRDPNRFTGHVMNFGLSTLDTASYLFQTALNSVANSRCAEYEKSCSAAPTTNAVADLIITFQPFRVSLASV